MTVHIHGFDWPAYTKQIMPAFASWFLERDETAIYQLFAKTRCAREEEFLPAPMQRLRVWLRAKEFVDSLPRGPHSRKEYTKLCSVDQFTALSDRYLHHHTPHLYQNNNAVRCMWGALIEEYCLPWLHTAFASAEVGAIERSDTLGEDEEAVRSELVTLLHAAGLGDLAREVDEHVTAVERIEWEPEPTTNEPVEEDEPDETEEDDLYDDEEDENANAPKGIVIGTYPNTLHLRGWLAGISLRAMALFEYLVCGRRSMPFGCEAGEPYGSFTGYLTSAEVWQLASALREVKPPGQTEAERDEQQFRQEQQLSLVMGRLVDEVLPAYASEFLAAVRRAAQEGLGLVCNVE